MREGLLPLVVFDGPGGPAHKRGKSGSAKGRTDPVARGFMECCDILGVPWIKADGEAEAELAELSRRGEIGGCLTVSVARTCDAADRGARLIGPVPSRRTTSTRWSLVQQPSSGTCQQACQAMPSTRHLSLMQAQTPASTPPHPRTANTPWPSTTLAESNPPPPSTGPP